MSLPSIKIFNSSKKRTLPEANKETIKLPSIIHNKPNDEDLIANFGKLGLDDESNEKTLSKKQQQFFDKINEYDDIEFSPEFYIHDEDSMTSFLEDFLKVDIDGMSAKELYEISQFIDPKEFPLKWSFCLHLSSCRISPKDCYQKRRRIGGKRSKKNRRRNKKNTITRRKKRKCN